MSQYNIADAKTHFSQLIQKALLGEEVIIAKSNQPLVKIVPLVSTKGRRKPGSGQGQLLFMADDFDATPDDFKDYM